MVFGLPMVDLGAGEHGYGQIMKALYRRATTGRGMRLDLSLHRSAVSWMVNPVMMTHSLNQPVTRRGNTHQFFGPVSVYATSDGYVYIAVGSDRQWAAITGLPDFRPLARPEYERNAGRIAALRQLNQHLAQIFRKFTTIEALELFRAIEVPISRVNTMAEVITDPPVAGHLSYVTDRRSGMTVALPAPPAGEAPSLSFPPRLGEHNRQIYGQVLGFTAATLADLRERGVI